MASQKNIIINNSDSNINSEYELHRDTLENKDYPDQKFTNCFFSSNEIRKYEELVEGDEIIDFQGYVINAKEFLEAYKDCLDCDIMPNKYDN